MEGRRENKEGGMKGEGGGGASENVEGGGGGGGKQKKGKVTFSSAVHSCIAEAMAAGSSA